MNAVHRNSRNSVVALAAIVLAGACSGPTDTACGNYAERIAALANGADKLLPETVTRLQDRAYDPADGLAGVSLGMTVDEVIAAWEQPRSVRIAYDGDVSIEIASSGFKFENSQLVEINVFCFNLPALTVKGDVGCESTLAQIAAHYQLSNPSTRVYVNHPTPQTELRFFFSEKDGKPITIRLSRR